MFSELPFTGLNSGIFLRSFVQMWGITALGGNFRPFYAIDKIY